MHTGCVAPYYLPAFVVLHSNPLRMWYCMFAQTIGLILLTLFLQALFVMDFHWHTQENPKITYFDSICTGRIDIAKQAAEALIQWTANEWEREQQELVPDAITPLPDRLQV